MPGIKPGSYQVSLTCPTEGRSAPNSAEAGRPGISAPDNGIGAANNERAVPVARSRVSAATGAREADLMDLEAFFTAHEHTVSAVEAASTFAAVVLALALSFISQRANRTRVKARASVTQIVGGAIYPTYVSVDITNVGLFAVTVPMAFFYWRIPFKRDWWLVQPLDYTQSDPWVRRNSYPVEIRPRSSQTFVLSDIAEFHSMLRDDFIGQTWLDRCRFAFLRATVRTDDGRLFKVQLDQSLRKEIEQIRHHTRTGFPWASTVERRTASERPTLRQRDRTPRTPRA